MSHIGRSQDATQELLAAALVIARSPTIRAWLLANDPMALQQLDTAVAAHHNTDPTAEPVHLVINDTDSSGTGSSSASTAKRPTCSGRRASTA
jgi:hypothetical protein